MTKYRYEGEEELVFPTLGLVIRNGDEFETDADLTINKLVVADTKKSKPITDKVVVDSELVETDSVNSDSKGE
jgi:hypothetical protein